MSIQIDFQGVAVARANLKKVFDATDDGKSVTLGRGDGIVVAVPLEKIQQFLFETIPAKIETEVSKDATWLYSTALPFHSEGKDVDAALEDMIAVLREYADDWEDHLLTAPNHSDYWGLVQLIKLSTDDQLKSWLER